MAAVVARLKTLWNDFPRGTYKEKLGKRTHDDFPTDDFRIVAQIYDCRALERGTTQSDKCSDVLEYPAASIVRVDIFSIYSTLIH
jgi:hypothetical protein